MRIGARSRTRFAVAVAMALSCVAVGLAVPTADAATQKPTKMLGPILTRDESKVVTHGTDGGMSVALPGGRDFWVFGDTPRYQFIKGKWVFKRFVAGSSVADGSYTRGSVPKPLSEIWVGHRRSTKYQPSVFIPAPTNVYLPDGSGKECSRANGAAEEGRWPTGATLMPNKDYVLVTYEEVCVATATNWPVEGWGFMIYNWRTNRIASGPVDVFKPAHSGATYPQVKTFSSPVVSAGNVTFFSFTCCNAGAAAYQTTMPANLAALSNPANYVPHVVSGMPTGYFMSVAGKSPTQPKLQLSKLLDIKGRFAIYTAPNPSGPWVQKATGLLPGCRTSPQPCYALYAHPELSKPGQLLVSYYLPGYGPGVKGHPYPHPPINHLVMAAVPYAS